MGAALLITLREGLEAALIISIVLAYLRQVGRRDAARQVWLGVGAALGLAAIVGAILYGLVGELEGDEERIVYAAITLAAVAMLTWMLFWMRKQARTASRELRAQLDKALVERSSWAVASVAFLAVIRDALETVLFMLAILAGSSALSLGLGAALGLAGAVALGIAIYRGGRRINLGLFFNLTGGLVLVIAAGMAAKSIVWLQTSGLVPTFFWPVWDASGQPLLGHGTVAQFLGSLFGWDPTPSIEELAVWLAYLVIFAYLYFLRGRKPGQHRTAQASPAVGNAAGD
jgi:high-affinity iron transporter